MSSLRQLGRYRIESFNGSRGEADAYRAFDMIRKRTVLLLALKPETAANQQKLGRILHNAQAVSELVHPRLGWVWETGYEDGVTYVAERFVNGPSLRERLDEGGALGWDEASQVLEQLAQGLDFLHSRGRVHGALRPETITLSPEVGAVLGGLGVPEAPLTLADLETAEEPGTAPQNQDDSGPGDGGPPAQMPIPEDNRPPERFAAAPYIAPEIWMGEASSPAADQYALACIFVEMVSGKPLFAGANASEICERSLEGPTLPAIWPAGTPWQIEPVLERALAQQPAERFASAGDFASAPARMAARTMSSEDERRQREAQRQTRLEAEAQARRQAEDAERQAALERARREVEEQAHREAEPQAATVSLPALASASAGAADVPTSPTHEARRRAPARAADGQMALAEKTRSQPAARWLRWPVWAGVILLLALAWLWGSGRLSGGGIAATPTASSSPVITQPALAAPSATASEPPTTEPSATSTETPKPSPTFTRRPTNTATQIASPTVTPTATQTVRPFITRRPPPTREPREDDGPDR
jgi:serine/threonine protein kinase